MANQQSLLGETLHRLANGSPANPEPAGQLGLTQLGAWLEFAVTDGLAQLVGDDAGRRLLGQQPDEAGHARSPNNTPSPNSGGTGPSSSRPFQTVT